MLGWNPADRLFYWPSRQVYQDPRDYGLACETVFFDSEPGLRLHGFFFPARGEPLGTVLHAHGNAGNVTAHFPLVAWLPPLGWNVLCFDYRGYGRSEGRITRAGSIRDTHAALDYLLGRPDVDGGRLVAFGQSIGGAIATVVAAGRPELRALVIDGAFARYREIARDVIAAHPLSFVASWWAPWVIVSDGSDPEDAIGRISPRPVMVVHGRNDGIVPWQMGRRLYEAAGEPKEFWLLDNVGHLEASAYNGEEMGPCISAFFRRAIEGRPVEDEGARGGTPAGQVSAVGG